MNIPVRNPKNETSYRYVFLEIEKHAGKKSHFKDFLPACFYFFFSKYKPLMIVAAAGAHQPAPLMPHAAHQSVPFITAD